MKATCIDYSETNSFSETLLKYIARDSKLEPFISEWPTIQNFGKALSPRASFDKRDVLVKTLQKQYSDSRLKTDDSTPVYHNIELLKNAETFTITTGHQLNIFTGPLYFIYKIVTAIKLAADLKSAYPDKNFVPVYWMATEDHDFEEINHTTLLGKKFSWDEKPSGATGRINPASILNGLKAYENALGISEHAKKLCSLLDEAYLKHHSLAEATRYLVHHLFESYGLVILDADAPELKKEFAPIVKDDILNQKSYQSITNTSMRLQESGFETQVHAREINFFYLKDNLRERIVFEDGKWQVLNTELSFNKEQLIAEIEQFPERFSPNVVMRPLYQEVILPNLAYIGGGAEIVYWLQLKSNFEQFKVHFPILVPRNSALIVNTSFSGKLARAKITISDFFKPSDAIKKEWVLKHSEHTLNLNAEWRSLEDLFEKLKQKASNIDPTLTASTEAIKARLRKALSNLEQKLIKAEKRNYESTLSQIDKLKEAYFPGGKLQERSENFASIYSRCGDEFIAELVRQFKPLDFKFTILES